MTSSRDRFGRLLQRSVIAGLVVVFLHSLKNSSLIKGLYRTANVFRQIVLEEHRSQI